MSRKVTSFGSRLAGGSACPGSTMPRLRDDRPASGPQREPDRGAAEPGNAGEIDPADRQAERRQHRPPAPQHFARDQQHGDAEQHATRALQPRRQHQRERRQEVAEHDQQAQRAPRAARAFKIPRRFGREIGLPDDQQLHEIEVDPQHHQREQQFAEVGAHVRCRPGRGQQHRHRQRQQRHAGGREHAVDRRDEMRIQRHRRVDRGERGGERQQQQPERRDARERADAQHRDRQNDPDHQVDRAAHGEERQVRVGAAGRAGPRPRIQPRQAEDQRDAGRQQQRDRARADAQGRPQRVAPAPAGEAVDQQQRDAAERPAEQQREGGEPAGVEPLPVQPPAECRQRQPGHAHATNELCCPVHGSAAFCSGVRSVTVAFWLRCNARM